MTAPRSSGPADSEAAPILRYPELTAPELYDRLAGGGGGGGARICVVTPNRRLAAAMTRSFDARMRARGIAAWDSADILPLAALVERLFDDAVHSERARDVPLLLTPAQELALWESVVADSPAGAALLSVRGAAALARDAWQIAHRWRIAARLRGTPANDDARAFADWAWRFEGLTARDRQTDRARLPDWVAKLLPHSALATPRTLVICGFDIIDPQSCDLIAALETAGVEVLAGRRASRAQRAVRVECADSAAELEAAARWARARLEAEPHARIGVVVPDLSRMRSQVSRIFAQVLDPALVLPDAPRSRHPPFDVSLGESLAQRPLVAVALDALELAASTAGAEIEFGRASRLLRSPFIGGAEVELAQRARLDAILRGECGASIDLPRLMGAVHRLTQSEPRGGVRVAPEAASGCPLLVRRLAAFAALAAERMRGARPPSQWAAAFVDLLAALGFPGERNLDSGEYQTLKKFHEMLSEFAALDRVVRRSDARAALERLAAIAADTLFQPQAGEAPIEVLGVLESAGMEFDHLWVSGLTAEAWPLRARVNPLLPVALARAAGVPQASAEGSFELDARITRGWLGCAPEVVLSHPLRDGDRDLAASALIAAVAAASVSDIVPAGPALPAQLIARARARECIDDACAPPIPIPARVGGGAGVFRDQSACPFRAFARWRLGAIALGEPVAGLDAAARGSLAHRLLAAVWRRLGDSTALPAAGDAALEALLAECAREALRPLHGAAAAIGARFAALEHERLMALAREWLDAERMRAPFAVAGIERRHAVRFAGIEVEARLDRVDRIAGAGVAVIDYKTGQAGPGDWLGERPGDPQLPIYALAAAAAHGERPVAVAIARLKAGEVAFSGLSRDENLIPGAGTLGASRAALAQEVGSWSQLFERWQRVLDTLGAQFARGDAAVDPQGEGRACRNCDLELLCRVGGRGDPDRDER